MSRKPSQAYQFKITLDEIMPSIWRRIQVPETYSFWDLHCAIQDSMGWLSYHLFCFKMYDDLLDKDIEIGIPDDEFAQDEICLPSWDLLIADFFSLSDPFADYIYDFGDNWGHTIELEAIIDREKGRRYPVCIAGERACPPEDVGGTWAYQDFLEAMLNPAHEEHEDMVMWIGGVFDSEKFDPGSVKFKNPKRWFKRAFPGGV